MKGVNQIPGPATAQQNGGIGPEMKPEFGPSTLNIKVSHGLTEYEVAVPSTSTFGDLKSIIVQKTALNPKTHKLLFRGKEKEDDEDLQRAGVKDNSKLLLMEDKTIGQNNPEEVMETSVISRGGEAVAQVREEVDKLADKVSSLKAVVDSGTKIDNKDILYLTEMLMRQLLKLDGIDAEGEGKVQRKMEVRRVQSFVDTMDIIKSRNSNPFNNAASVTTQWETFDPSCGNATAASPVPLLSHIPNPTSYSSFTPSHAPNPVSYSSFTPLPSHAPNPTSYSSPTPLPSLAPNPTSYSSPTPLLSLAPNPTSYSSPTPLPSHAPNPTSYLPSHAPNPTSYLPSYAPNSTSYLPPHAPNPTSYSSFTTLPSHAPNPTYYPSPTPLPSHAPTPTPFSADASNPSSFPSPTHIPTSAPVSSLATSPMPSTKVTQDWEPFD